MVKVSRERSTSRPWAWQGAYAPGSVRLAPADVGCLWEYARKLLRVRRFRCSKACSLGTVGLSRDLR